MNTALELNHLPCPTNDSLFELLSQDIYNKGYSILPNALPLQLAEDLLTHLNVMSEQKFKLAGIGRENSYLKNEFVRTDEICWITGESVTGQAWLNWTEQLQQFLNRRLFLGLFSFESHFAHYSAGSFYKRHKDAFTNQGIRVLSLVVYLNKNWTHDDQGELVLYMNNKDKVGIKVTPSFGTIVAFLSEEFPHEVLPANRDRYSVAGWFRKNMSTKQRVDPAS